MSTYQTPLMVNLISASVAAADKAGTIVRDILKKGDLGIVDKGINDLQTQADRSAQKCIVASLSKHFPKISIIGEETLEENETIQVEWIVDKFNENALSMVCPQEYASVKDEQVVVWVDPLDGTAEYTQGLLDHVTVLIGIAVSGKAVAGIIHQPFYNYQVEKDFSKLGRTIWGLVGLGANGIKRNIPPSDQRIVTTTRSHSNKLINAAIEAIKPDNILRVGGAGHKVLLLIEGKAHAYVFASSGCKKWDTCAPQAILQSVGGKLTDILGNTLEYHKEVEHLNRTGVLATFSADDHEWYLNKIPLDVKASLSA